MSKTFLEEISSVIAEEKGSLMPQMLYEMCDERLHPWGVERQLRDKLRIVCGVYGLNLRENYLCYAEVNGRSRHREIDPAVEIASELTENVAYGAFVGKIASYKRGYAFDGSTADFDLFKESFRLVFELNDLLCNTVTSYDRFYRQPERNRGNFYALASQMLHLHRPQAFFPYGREIRSGLSAFYNADGCRIGEVRLEGAEHQEIALLYCAATRSAIEIGETLPLPKQNYICAAALQYSLCAYLLRHGVPFEGPSPIAPAAALVVRFKRIKTQEELVRIAKSLRRDTPIKEAKLYCCDAVEFEQVLALLCTGGRK